MCSILSIDEPRTVVIYSSFNGVNCEVTVASDGVYWVRPEYMKVFMAYPFRQLGCKRISLLIIDSNQRVIKLAKKIGFTEEGLLRKFMESGEDVHVLSMLKEEYENSEYYEEIQ